MSAIDTVKDINITDAAVTLWTFRGPYGPASSRPKYSERWIETTDAVDYELKSIFQTEVGRIVEVKDYGILEENNESSALLISVEETYAGYIIDQTATDSENKRVSELKHIQNSSFYVAKFTHPDVLIHAIRKTDAIWKTKRSVNIQSLFFQDGQLDLDQKPHFDITRTFDFIIVGNEILCLNKRNFESILRYKQAYEEDFVSLQAEREFVDVFANLAPLAEFVGNNKNRLRRASAIREKGHYKDTSFIQRLQKYNAECGLTLKFDIQGRIIATPDTCSDIMTALLDHRLLSRFSERFYDVPSSSPVQLESS